MENARGSMGETAINIQKCTHVSISLCFRVTVLKSLNYARKNLMHAYICMKAYTLAGTRQASTAVGFASNKRQKQAVRFVSLPELSGGSLQQTLFRDVYGGPFSFLHPYSASFSLPGSGLPSLEVPGLLPSSGFQPRRFRSLGDVCRCTPRDAPKIWWVLVRDDDKILQSTGRPYSQTKGSPASVVLRLRISALVIPSRGP